MARIKAFEETEVLNKIQKLFLRKGFNGTSVDDLVKESGLSRSSLYDTFIDKENLFLLSLTLYRIVNTNTIVKQIEESSDIKKTISYLFDNIIAESQQKKKYGCLMVNTAIELAPHNKKVCKVVDDNMEAMHAALLKKIKQAQAAGKINKNTDAYSLTSLIITCIAGMRVGERHNQIQKKQIAVKQLIESLL
jgi:TetR/AcrR family transcriptional repressor of nem operon